MAKLKEAHKRVAKKKPALPLGEQLAAVLAAKECDVKKARSLIMRGADPNTVHDGDPVLVIAARKNLIKVAEALLAKGADPNSTCDRGQSAILVCSYKGHPEIAEMLLAKGANPNTPQDDLYPLALACQYGYTSIAKGLIDHGALLDVQDSYGNTPLIRAAYEGAVEIVEALLQKGANIEIADKDGRTALMSVGLVQCKRDYVGPPRKKMRIAELLIEAGADTRHVDKNNHTALDIAGGSKHHEINAMISDKNVKNDKQDLEQGIPLRKDIKVCSPIKLKFGG
ncbi:MAG: ankyrin repeat domain-containing protein [Alphaproteobacteria bacterium]